MTHCHLVSLYRRNRCWKPLIVHIPASEKCWYRCSVCLAPSSGNQPHPYCRAATSSGLAPGPFSHHCVTAGLVSNGFGCYFCKEAADASGLTRCQSTHAGNLAIGDIGGSCRHARPGRKAIALVSVQKGNKKIWHAVTTRREAKTAHRQISVTRAVCKCPLPASQRTAVIWHLSEFTCLI